MRWAKYRENYTFSAAYDTFIPSQITVCISWSGILLSRELPALCDDLDDFDGIDHEIMEIIRKLLQSPSVPNFPKEKTKVLQVLAKREGVLIVVVDLKKLVLSRAWACRQGIFCRIFM